MSGSRTSLPPEPVRVGCSGWNYADWRDLVYPKGLRFHYGKRGRNGNYSERELDEWAERIETWGRRVQVFAYFNNDWRGYAVKNGLRLKNRLQKSI